jgi:hypothetical protein
VSSYGEEDREDFPRNFAGHCWRYMPTHGTGQQAGGQAIRGRQRRWPTLAGPECPHLVTRRRIVGSRIDSLLRERATQGIARHAGRPLVDLDAEILPAAIALVRDALENDSFETPKFLPVRRSRRTAPAGDLG